MRFALVFALCALFALCAACGGRSHPKGPPKPDPQKLAAALDADVRALHELSLRLEGQCDPLVAELKPRIASMRTHADDVKVAMDDRELAPKLKAEVKRYGAQHQPLVDATGESLAKSYLGCNKDARILELVEQIPVLQ